MTYKRLAVVTGGASGIGEACVRKFAAEGWRTVVADRNTQAGSAVAEALVTQGHDSRFLPLDVASEESVEKLVSRVRDEFGPVDSVVNSAGLLQGSVRLLRMDVASYDAIMNVNLRGAMLVGRAFGEIMCAAGGGAILNICSISSFRASAQPAYATSKAGLKMLTEIMAAEFGAAGVRVNAVAPGYTMTPLMAGLIAKGQRDPDAVIEKSALGRFVETAEVADGAYFLCSDAARAITGVTLPIDCGWLVGSAYRAYATQPE